MPALVDVVRILATILNTLMYLSPVPTMAEIHRKKSVGPMPFVPLVSMISNGHAWAVYGLLAKDYIAIFGTCAFGMIVASFYVAIYYQYTNDKVYARKVLAVLACVVLINTAYPILGVYGYTNQSHNGVQLTVGYIASAISVAMYSSPLEKIRLVLKHRSAVFIPIPIVVMGACNSLSWVIYTLLDIDLLVMISNAMQLLVGLVQIAVYWTFHPATHPLQPEAIDALTAGAKDLDVMRLSAANYIVVDNTRAAKEATFVALRSPA